MRPIHDFKVERHDARNAWHYACFLDANQEKNWPENIEKKCRGKPGPERNFGFNFFKREPDCEMTDEHASSLGWLYATSSGITQFSVTTLHLETIILAPIELCFDASRDVGLHLGSAADTGERVVAGRTSGLCELGDEITWEARHFGVRQELSVKIVALDYPNTFTDAMTRGVFRSMVHKHTFVSVAAGTRMVDVFAYEVPFSIAGKIFDALVLRRHMLAFLEKRNLFLKAWCEEQVGAKPASAKALSATS